VGRRVVVAVIAKAVGGPGVLLPEELSQLSQLVARSKLINLGTNQTAFGNEPIDSFL